METNSPIQYLTFARSNASHAPLVCYARTMSSSFGVWKGENPLVFSIPLFLFQVILVVISTRITAFLLRPLRQHRYISDVIGGFVLGPSIMGRIPDFNVMIFPLRSLIILDTMSHLGLVYFIFTVGVEVEKNVIKRKGAKALAFAAGCMVPSFAIGSLSGIFIHRRLQEATNEAAFITFLGFTLSINSFSVLARVLAEQKLVGSEIGRLALSSAMLSDICAWILLAFSIGLAQSDGDLLSSLWTVLSGITLLLFSYAVLKPGVLWVQRRTPEGEDLDEIYACVLLVGVMVWAFIADALGTHAIFGAFVFGLSVPNGPLGEALIEKVEDFVAGILMPLFFVISGLRTDVYSIKDPGSTVLLIIVVLAGAASKVASGAFLAATYRMPLHEGMSLGILMNTKGLVDVIILNIGRSKMILGNQSFTILVVMSVVVTTLVSPLLKAVVRPSKRLVFYKRRTIWWPNPDSELRLLTCVHVPRQVPGLIALLDISHPTKRSPIFVYALHLIELTGRTSAILLNATPADASPSGNQHAHGHGHGRIQAQSDHIFHAFESYDQYAGGVSIQFLTAISPYATMHEDVISAAEDRHAALILLPFHKHHTVDGGMRPNHPACRAINQSVLSAAPCSVGILIDRGLGSHRATRRITLFFFGGPDDREALALASRMAGHPAINVTVLRFVHAARAHSQSGSPKTERVVTVAGEDEERDWRIDEECVGEFRERWGGGIAEYEERVVSNAEETVAVIRGVDGIQDMYVVGRGHGKESPLTAGLTDWSECPELGPIGDLLASPDFGTTASVLVLQQGKGGAPADAMMEPKGRVYMNKADHHRASKQIPGTRV
ncbi:unnamed protein product [Musa acuminata var. zebrina]